jgi:hypothetical protein
MWLYVIYKKKFGKKRRKESDPELDLDPGPLVRGTDPHLNVTDPQHCTIHTNAISTGPLNRPLGFNGWPLDLDL